MDQLDYKRYLEDQKAQDPLFLGLIGPTHPCKSLTGSLGNHMRRERRARRRGQVLLQDVKGGQGPLEGLKTPKQTLFFQSRE